MRATTFVVVLSLVLLSTAALADVPGLINHQGTLVYDDGTAVDTTVAMTFKIYDDSTGVTDLWYETHDSVHVENSLFNVLLGSVTTIPDDLFYGPDRWLGIQVGDESEMQPRQRISSVGYAFKAAEADTAEYSRNPVDDGDWIILNSDMCAGVPGNVGIGTCTPEDKLDVSGDINVDSSYSYKIGGATVLFATGWAESNNTFVGIGAGANTISPGSNNTFLGGRAGHYNTIGSFNTFLGGSAGISNTTGDCNTYLGRDAGFLNSTGTGNVFIGYRAGYYEYDSNKLYIANGSGTDNVLIYGDFWTGEVGIGTLNPTAKLDIKRDTGYDQLRMRTSYTPTGTADANGNEGDIAWDDNYVYIKTSVGWKRAALSTF